MAYPDNPEVASSYSFQIYDLGQSSTLIQGRLTEREGSVQLTSLLK
jgi:hypothetical protein